MKIEAAPAWKDSLNKSGGSMAMFEGGFLPDFMQAMQYWYDHGIRMFKFDFVDLGAATPASEAKLTKAEIKEIFLQVAIYCGIPASLDAFKTASGVFKDRGI